jgi:ferredoxin
MKLREALIAYHEAGGSIPVILFHDEDHGTALINALSRHGDGLPANVIPMAVNEITAIGLDALAGSFAYGARAVRILASDRPKHPLDGLDRTVSTMEAIAAGFGLGSGLTSIIAATDPDAVAEALRSPALASPIAPAAFLPLGSGRPLLKLALSELQVRSPNKAAAIQLPERAPFGGVRVNVEGCTLCLACVSACPTGALSDNPDRPMLRFSEELCVQCGLCQSTCPERVITLEPRLDMRAWQAPPIVVKEEEPFHCVACGKPFGVKSTIDRITAKLQGSHWMYSGANASRLRALQMCDDCRVEVMMNEAFDPHSPGERPLTRTSDDYFRARETKGDS